MTQRTFADWLSYIESLSLATIDLGLHRIKTVLDRLDTKTAAKIITVGGTNGKGSTSRYLESILCVGKYRVGCYQSPHLVAFNERIRIDGEPVGDALLIKAFERVEAARHDVELTFFEFTTLTAWVVFCQHALDVLVLEVGLGGKLDAVNVFDADCAIITSISIDHTDYLGDTLESIGAEKAGIFRSGKPAIIGLSTLPESIKTAIDEGGVQAFIFDQDYGIEVDETLENRQWGWWIHRKDGEKIARHALPLPAIRGTMQCVNAATALTALDCLKEDLPLSLANIKEGLVSATLSGRFQQLSVKPSIIVDVAHNPEAAGVLAETLQTLGKAKKTLAIFGMLQDKDIDEVVVKMASSVDAWYVTTLDSPRSEKAERITHIIRGYDGNVVGCFEQPMEAWKAAVSQLTDDDRIIIFGSFILVGWLLGLPDHGLKELPMSPMLPINSSGSAHEQPIHMTQLVERRS